MLLARRFVGHRRGRGRRLFSRSGRKLRSTSARYTNCLSSPTVYEKASARHLVHRGKPPNSWALVYAVSNQPSPRLYLYSAPPPRVVLLPKGSVPATEDALGCLVMKPVQHRQTAAIYVTLPGAADILSVTPDVVRSRLRRGKLRREQGEDGSVSILYRGLRSL
jgi:hypothetical protein